ncbi:MAG: hypothetical protein O3A85_05730 [Proteobacteria bacterium]|nr:hypothetical protein [Pseudomonadota bacterium]
MVFGFFTYPKRLNDLFCDAVNVWLILEDEDALEVAANAVLTAAQEQRDSMIHYAATADKIFELMYGDAGAIPTSDSGGQTIELDTVKKRLEILLGKFEEIQGVSLMQARKAMKRENEKAVQKGDTSYFRSRYPDFSLW